jgi:transcriptional regulator with XRE-family HTH domain
MPPESFSEQLKAYRKAMGWTQAELGKRWNYSFETISAWERGKRNPAVQEIPRIANLMGVPSELLAQDIDPSLSGVYSYRNRELLTQVSMQERTSALGTWGELVQIYRDRTELNRDFSYPRMFENASQILAVGISLNAIAMNYSRAEIINSIIDHQRSYQLCFLDPKGVYCNEREREEDIPQGSLADLTHFNIQNMGIIQKQLSKINPDGIEKLQLMTYDLPPRFNIYVVDDSIMTVQAYAYGRGEDTPVFVLRRQSSNGLFDFYSSVAKHILVQAKPMAIKET